MIEIKWLLYRYHSIKQARDTAHRMLSVVEKTTAGHDPNWWIHGKGGFPKSRTELSFFQTCDNTDRIAQLQEYVSNLDMIIAAIDSAMQTVKKDLHDLIKYRYIEDMDVLDVADKLDLFTPKGELNMRKYYRLHNIALEAMNIGCMPLNFVFNRDDIEIMLGKLGVVRKSVTSVSQNRVESELLTS